MYLKYQDLKPRFVAMSKLVTSVACLMTCVSQLHAFPLGFTVVDPVGDNTGPIDVTSMVFSFDNDSGDYTIDLTSTEANPFVGEFRVNINLFNPDTGTTAADPSFFEDTLNDRNLLLPVTAISLSGTNPRLRSWKAGDNVFTNSLAGTGNPDGTSLFRSAVGSFPPSFLTNEDTIAYADKAQSAVIASVPEPSSLALLGLGLATLGIRSRRNRRTA